MNEFVYTFCTLRDTTKFTADFNDTQTYLHAASIIQAYFVGRPSLITSEVTNYWNATREVELFLLALPVRNATPRPEPGSIEPSNPTLKALCDKNVKKYNDGPCYYSASTVAFITGTIDGRGVGMTPLSVAL
jgi:hypothetical protein